MFFPQFFSTLFISVVSVIKFWTHLKNLACLLVVFISDRVEGVVALQQTRRIKIKQWFI